MEIVNARVSARIAVPRARNSFQGAIPPLALTRIAYFGPQVGLVGTPVIARNQLADRRDGPFIVEEHDATTLVPPGWQARLDEDGNIILFRRGRPQ